MPIQPLFLDCHTKIRFFLEGFEKIIAKYGDPRAPAAAAQIARYLREGLPLHAQDEDLSLAPRLLQVHPELSGLLAELAEDHLRMDAGMPAVLALLDRWAAVQPPPRPELAEASHWLNSVLLPHLEREEKELFPACDGIPEEEEIRREMRARRG